MKKPILIICSFLLIALVAAAYTIQSMNPQTIPLSIKRYIPSTHPNPGAQVSMADSPVDFEWKLGNPYLLRNGSGDVYLELRVTGKDLADGERKPMNLVLVMDRSGSMGSENKLNHVKEAAVSIVNRLSGSDRLAIVTYDDTIQTLLPSSPVENKGSIRELIYSLSPGGSTNLHGGMMQGFTEAMKSFRKGHLNRIILLSDGLANAGITHPDQIAKYASQIRENFISISTMGVGLDYNENLMANIADHSGGNYYYISRDVNMAEIFRQEWNLMQKLVATEARATLQLAKGIRVVDVAGFKWNQDGKSLTIQVPDISSGESRRIFVHLRASADSVRTIHLATGQFACLNLTTPKPENFQLAFSPSIQVVENRALVQNNQERDVQVKAGSVAASKRMERAYSLFESGDAAAAREVAAEAAEDLNSLGYVENEAQVGRYRDFAQRLASPESISDADKKDILKKQKEEERKALQNDPQ